MKKRLIPNVIAGLLIGTSLWCGSARAAGMNPNETVDTTVTADAIAQSLVGPGVAISNVQYTGAPDARGTFAFIDERHAASVHDQGVLLPGKEILQPDRLAAQFHKAPCLTANLVICVYLVPEGVTARAPTTDTFSLAQSQEEFFFALPVKAMDLVLYALNEGWSPERAAAEVGLTAEQVEREYKDIQQKRSTTRYLHSPPLLAEQVPQVHLAEEDEA